MDFRQKVISTYEEGNTSIRTVAQRFRISPDTVQQWLKRKRATGSLAPKKLGGGPPGKLEGHDGTLAQLVADHPDWTLKQYQEHFHKHHQIWVSESVLCRKLQKLKLSLKKPSAPAKPAARESRSSELSTGS